MDMKRLVPDRFRRVWHLAQHIADEPGHSRRELADRFHLSERQIQADLNIVRDAMRLPLVRRQGYRFTAEGGTTLSTGFGLSELVTLAAMVERTRRDRSVIRKRLDALLVTLPLLVPPHLHPLASALLARTAGPEQRVLHALATALLECRAVRLHGQVTPSVNPVVTPELLVPYLGGWYVIGATLERRRDLMARVDGLTAVTVEATPERAGVA